MSSASSSLFKRVIPLLDRIVVRKFKPTEKTASGIYIPEKSQENIQQGEVIAVGPGDKDYKMSLSVGDKIIFPSFGGTSYKFGEETVFIFRENEIPAKLQD